MNCPACDRYTPDDSPKCVNCGILVTPPPPAGLETRIAPPAPLRPRSLGLLLSIAGIALAVALFLLFRSPGGGRAVNAHRPGEEIEIAGFIPAGKMTIIDFYSEYCPPCREISPKLEKLAQKRQDLAILKFDINRKGIKGIDWGSPLARQYGLLSVPSFKVFNAKGELQAEGPEAFTQVVNLLVQERLW